MTSPDPLPNHRPGDSELAGLNSPSSGDGKLEEGRFRRSMKYFLCVLGLVFVLEGLPYFAFPDKVKAYLLRLAAVENTTLRIIGFVAVAAGLLLVYF